MQQYRPSGRYVFSWGSNAKVAFGRNDILIIVIIIKRLHANSLSFTDASLNRSAVTSAKFQLFDCDHFYLALLFYQQYICGEKRLQFYIHMFIDNKSLIVISVLRLRAL